MAFAIMPPSIPGLGSQGGFTLWLQDRSGGSIEFLDAQTAEVPGRRAEAARAGRRDVDVHRARAAGLRRRRPRQGASPGRGARRRLSDDADVPGRAVRESVQPVRTAVARVRAGGRARTAWRPSRSGSSTSGTTPARWCRCRRCNRRRRTSGPQFTNRFNVYRAAQINGAAAPGYSSGQAMAALEEVARTTLPREIGYDWARPVVSGEDRRRARPARSSRCRWCSCS